MTDIIGLVFTSFEFIVDAILVGRFIDVIFLVVGSWAKVSECNNEKTQDFNPF